MLSIRSKDLYLKNERLIEQNVKKGFAEGKFSVEAEIADGSQEIQAIQVLNVENLLPPL